MAYRFLELGLASVYLEIPNGFLFPALLRSPLEPMLTFSIHNALWQGLPHQTTLVCRTTFPW